LSSDNLGALAGNNTGVRNVGVISVTDTVLGFGGHGTVVYRGTLDGRQVAVKRMLKAYHASADREIALLIESDGHLNVVRYFLKEVKGDFVYLALELCDMSLHDLIVKLRHASSEGPMQSQLLSITKSTLYQIACGVRHLHSLRIVHR
jgi:serine/threonine-protein kinase/endoribonuclease IRE1